MSARVHRAERSEQGTRVDGAGRAPGYNETDGSESTFSCRTRQLCPSCGAKRGVIFGAFLREEVVEPVRHAQWVFNTHPHVHAIASRGGWTRDGTWVPVPYVDSGAAARWLRHSVLRLLLDAALISEERVAMILGWRHTSGFSVHNDVVVQPGDGGGSRGSRATSPYLR